MTNQRKNRLLLGAIVGLLAGALAGCGGGGGNGGVTPPSPTSSVTYTLELTVVTLTDRQTGADVSETGLPISGAVATR
jgi:hypothetical protein